MSQQFFEVERGFLVNGAAFIAGNGSPTGTGDSAAVGIGSVYHDTSSGDLYIKKIAGAGAGNWSKIAMATDVGGASWREPAKVNDSASLTIPTGTAGNTITVDGVTIDDGERVLFSATTDVATRNTFIYDKASGTFIEDTNAETMGDMIFVSDGTDAGKTFAFNSSTNLWVQNNSTSLQEEGYIRAFIGKSASGNVLPTYSATNYITNGDSIQTAIGKLDAQIKANSTAISTEVTDRDTAITNVQNEIDAVETGAGLNANGTYSANGLANYISSATSLKNADTLLDAQLKSVDTQVQSTATTVAQQATLLAAARAESISLGVTTTTVVDSVNCQGVVAAKWTVYVQGTSAGDAGNRQAIEILAMHDGTQTVDATLVDYTKYAKLKMGTISGLNVIIALSGTGATQKMELQVSSALQIDVRAAREVIKF